MQVTKITKKDKKVDIYLGNTKLSIYESVFSSYNLYINKIIGEEILQKIKEDNKIEEYFLYAVKRLSISQYSPKKVEDFLYKKGANKEQIKKVLKKLQKFNFVDEENIVKEIISFCDSKHYGFYRIIKMLNEKKINQKVIQKVKYNLNREENEAIFQIKLLNKRYERKNNFGRKKSIFSALVNYGFDEQLSLELANKFSNSNHNHEINVLKLDYAKVFLKYSRKYTGIELNQKITANLLSKGYQINDINYVKEHK